MFPVSAHTSNNSRSQLRGGVEPRAVEAALRLGPLILVFNRATRGGKGTLSTIPLQRGGACHSTIVLRCILNFNCSGEEQGGGAHGDH